MGEREKRQISVRFRKEDCNVGRRHNEGRKLQKTEATLISEVNFVQGLLLFNASL